MAGAEAVKTAELLAGQNALAPVPLITLPWWWSGSQGFQAAMVGYPAQAEADKSAP